MFVDENDDEEDDNENKIENAANTGRIDQRSYTE